MVKVRDRNFKMKFDFSQVFYGNKVAIFIMLRKRKVDMWILISFIIKKSRNVMH